MPGYDAEELETLIDEARLSTNWELVLEATAKYLHLFDVGTAQNTRQHESANEVKAYYWTVVAEAIFETGKGGLVKAVESAQKSVEVCPEYGDARIILCRILLGVCMPYLRQIELHIGDSQSLPIGGFLLSTVPPVSSFPLASEVPSYQSVEVFAEAFSASQPPSQQLPASDQNQLLEILADAPAPCRNMLLLILDSLSIPDQLFTCNQVLAIARCAPNKRPSQNVLFATWVLTTARLLLSAVRLDGAVAQFSEGTLSPYRLGLKFDAVACRCTISELLGETLQARGDTIHIVRHGSAGSLPLCCCGVVSAAIGRLPQLEATMGMIQEALASFDRGLAASAELALPIPLLLGIKVHISVLLLERAANNGAGLRRAGQGQAPSSPLPGGSAAADINKAGVLLGSVRADMSTTLSDDHAPRLTLAPLEPLHNSLVIMLPRPLSDPHNIASFASSRIVCSALAAVMLWQTPLVGSEETYSPHAEKYIFHDAGQGPQARAAASVASVIEWGCRLEVNASADLPYWLARAMLDAGFETVDVVRSLLLQSHRLTLQEMELDQASKAMGIKRSPSALKMLTTKLYPLLRWLGLYPGPSVYSWQPSAALADLSLRHCDPAADSTAALDVLRNQLIELYGAVAEELLVATGSDEACQGVGAGAYFDPDAPDYSLVGRYARIAQDHALLPTNDAQTVLVAELKALEDKICGQSEGTGQGVLELLVRLGMLHAAQGRWGSEPELERRGHLLAALRCFDVYLATSARTGAEAGPLLPEARLQRVLLLAELGQVEAATKATRAALDTTSSNGPGHGAIMASNNNRLVHLLALLQAGAGGDDPVALGSSVALCQRILGSVDVGTLSHASVSLSLGWLLWQAGDREGAVGAARSVLDHFCDTEVRRRTALQNQALNVLLSGTGGADSRVSGFEFESEANGEPDPLERGEPVIRLSRSARRKGTSLLTGAARLLRQSGELSAASQCLEQAWLLLFTAADLSTPAMAENAWVPEHRAREALAHVPTLLGWRLPECSGWAAAREAGMPDCEAAVLVEAGRLALARRPAAETAWPAAAERLLRFALAVCPTYCPALTAVAELELAKAQSAGTDVGAGAASNGKLLSSLLNGNASEKTQNSAAALRPLLPGENPFEAIAAAKEFGVLTRALEESKLLHNQAPGRSDDLFLGVTLGEQGHDSRAYEFALLAVRAGELDPAAWGIYGLALQRNHQPHRAVEALLAVLEIGKLASGRGPSGAPPFSCVL